MKKATAIFLLSALPHFCFSQDSTKIITHEAGLNIIGLIRQVSLFTPSDEQLPYDLFYNVYFKRIGIRTGFGIHSNQVETQIEGQELLRITLMQDHAVRLGLSYNIVKYKKVSINLLADYVWLRQSLESATTTTIQTFPNPITKRTVKSSDIREGKGARRDWG